MGAFCCKKRHISSTPVIVATQLYEHEVEQEEYERLYKQYFTRQNRTSRPRRS